MSAPNESGTPTQGHTILSTQLYLRIFGTLVALTVITVTVSYLDLGPNSIYVALLIAFIKAALVLGFFMHLRYGARLHQLVFVGSLVFLLTMFGFTFVDLSTRDSILPEQGNFALATERANARALDEVRKARPHPPEKAAPPPAPPAAASPATAKPPPPPPPPAMPTPAPKSVPTVPTGS